MLRQQWKKIRAFKTESGLRYQFIQRGEGKSCSWKKSPYHEGSLELESF
jgi:hypothetical protein